MSILCGSINFRSIQWTSRSDAFSVVFFKQMQNFRINFIITKKSYVIHNNNIEVSSVHKMQNW